MLANLADIYRLKGDGEQWEAWLQRWLADRQKALGENTPPFATALDALGSLDILVNNVGAGAVREFDDIKQALKETYKDNDAQQERYRIEIVAHAK